MDIKSRIKKRIRIGGIVLSILLLALLTTLFTSFRLQTVLHQF